MAAIGLAAAVLAERHGADVVLGSFAADQVIHGSRAFERAVREGVEAAHAGYVVTVGIAASHASTAFGYVRSGHGLGLPSAPTALHAVGFTEKPDVATATAYLATGEYRWNAGMFLVRAGVLLDHLAEQRPALHAGLRTLAAVWDSSDRGARDAVLDEVWPGLEKIAIDHAIAEPVAAAGTTSEPRESSRTTCASSPSTRAPSSPSPTGGRSVDRDAKSPMSSQPKSPGTTATPPAAATGSAIASPPVPAPSRSRTWSRPCAGAGPTSCSDGRLRGPRPARSRPGRARRRRAPGRGR